MKYPSIIEIQFHNICNSYCSICPYEKYASINTFQKMNNHLKTKILEDLKCHQKYIKRIIPYYNNEPFVENDFINTLRWFKKNLPNVKLEVSTNLSLCKKEQLEAIISENLIDDFRISFFGGTEETYKKMMPRLNFQKNIQQLNMFFEVRKKINPLFPYMLIMVLLPQLDIKKERYALNELFPNEKINYHFFGYLDRAGSNKEINSKISDTIKDVQLAGCSLNRNTERLCICFDGRVPLCSQDWFCEANIGNLEKQDISDIWNSKEREIINNKVSGILSSEKDFICKRCKLARLKLEGDIKLNFCGDRYTTQNDKKKLEEIDD